MHFIVATNLEPTLKLGWQIRGLGNLKKLKPAQLGVGGVVNKFSMDEVYGLKRGF